MDICLLPIYWTLKNTHLLIILHTYLSSRDSLTKKDRSSCWWNFSVFFLVFNPFFLCPICVVTINLFTLAKYEQGKNFIRNATHVRDRRLRFWIKMWYINLLVASVLTHWCRFFCFVLPPQFWHNFYLFNYLATFQLEMIVFCGTSRTWLYVVVF